MWLSLIQHCSEIELVDSVIGLIDQGYEKDETWCSPFGVRYYKDVNGFLISVQLYIA